MATKPQSADVDQTVTNVTSTKNLSPFQAMIRTMEMEATADVENAEFRGDDLTPVLTAETEEEIWEADERGPLNAQHLAGCELELIDLAVKYSRGGQSDIQTPFVSNDGKKMYLIVTAARISDANDKGNVIKLPPVGETFQFNTSARYLTVKLFQFYRLGYFGGNTGKTLEAMIRETDLGDGQAVIKLRPIPRRAVRTVAE